MNKIAKMVLVTGIVGVGITSANSSFAQSFQAYASGSASTVLMNGASQSIGGEVAGAPGGAFDLGQVEVRVNPTIVTGSAPAIGTGPDLSTNGSAALMDNLNIYAGNATAAPSVNSSVEAAVAAKINAATPATLSDGVSFTRAWQSGLQ